MRASLISYCAPCIAALGLAGCGGNDGADKGGGNSAGVSTNDAGGKSGAGEQPSGGKSSGGASGGESAGKAGEQAQTGGKTGAGTPIEGCAMPASAAPAMTWVNATGNLAQMASECGNLGLVSAQPCSNRVIAGVAQKGLWETVDGGKTWTELGQGDGSDKITNRISAIVYDPTDPKIFWESGIYNGGGVYQTFDSGETLKLLGDVHHCDSVSVDFSDPERKTILAGSHESNTTLNLSSDGGKTWTNLAHGLPDGQCTATAVIDQMTFLVGCNSGTIVRSEDGGASWKPVPGSTLGGTFQPLIAADGTIYWPGASGGVAKSEDQGKSFSKTPADAPGVIAPAQLAELPDGRIVTIGKDHLIASSDRGATWSPIGDKLPFAGGGFNGAPGVTYSALTKTFFVWHWDCSNNVEGDAIMSMGFDWEAM